MSATTNRMSAAPSFATGRKRRRMAPAALGPATAPEVYRGDRPEVLRFLNQVLATELVCVLRYRRHHFMARSAGARRTAEEFLVHADEELAHADLIADRIMQLGGEPDFAPTTLSERSLAQYAAAHTLVEMVRENLAAARVAIDCYRAQIDQLGDSDRITRRMLEGILGVQEAHADELIELLEQGESG